LLARRAAPHNGRCGVTRASPIARTDTLSFQGSALVGDWHLDDMSAVPSVVPGPPWALSWWVPCRWCCPCASADGPLRADWGTAFAPRTSRDRRSCRQHSGEPQGSGSDGQARGQIRTDPWSALGRPSRRSLALRMVRAGGERILNTGLAANRRGAVFSTLRPLRPLRFAASPVLNCSIIRQHRRHSKNPHIPAEPHDKCCGTDQGQRQQTLLPRAKRR
jgi:hypothetical protein